MASPRRDQKKARERQVRAARRAAQHRRRLVKMFAVVITIALLFGGVGAALSAVGGDKDNASSTTTTAPATPAPCPAADGSSTRTIDFPSGGQSTCIDPAKVYTATFDTTEGKIVVALDTAKTPQTVNNFVALSRYHYYDATTIFRTDPSIDIIQGGSPHSQNASDPGPGYNIADEGTGFKYAAGDLVMARGADGGGAQYFFGTGPNVSNLDSQGTYVTFGRTTEGLDVLKKIIGLHQDTGSSLGGQPIRTVTVNTVTITESGK